MMLYTMLASYEYTPFRNALPLWDYWWVLLFPLCLGISIVYKSIRCASMDQVPRQALGLLVFILIVMAMVGAGLAALVLALE
jgi:hypothetical protein